MHASKQQDVKCNPDNEEEVGSLNKSLFVAIEQTLEKKSSTNVSNECHSIQSLFLDNEDLQ